MYALTFALLSLVPQGDAPKPEKPVETKTVRIQLRVLDSEGQPIAGAGLKAVSPKTAKDCYAFAKAPDAKSGPDGRIELQKSYPSNESRTWMLVAKRKASMVLRVRTKKQTKKGAEVWVAELGDVVMHPGASILGLVRGAQGEKLKGARVTATEVLQNVLADRYQNRTHSTVCYGVSDENGRVRLVGIPTYGVSVTVTASGYYGWSKPYLNRHTPLVATLEKGGQVTGVVLDPDGKPVKDANLYVYSEASTSGTSHRTKEDGKFKIDLPGKGRYRIRYYAKFGDNNRYSYEYSKLYSEPEQDLELRFGTGAMDQRGNRIVKAAGKVKAAAAKKAKKKMVNLRILDDKSKIALREARATAVWWQPNMFEHNHGYLENQMRREKYKKLTERGVLEISGPGRNQPPTGRILVSAKGYAPYLIKDVEFNEEGDNKIEVRMTKESAVSGVVVDPKSGKPLPGVKIFAVTDPSQLRTYNPPPVRRKFDGTESVTTDKDGKFRVGQLHAGNVQIYLAHPERADLPPFQFDLKEAAELGNQRIEYPKGGTLFGKLTGAAIKPGWKVEIRKMQEQVNHFGPTYGLNPSDACETARVDDDGKFQFQGLSRANYTLSLVFPKSHGSLRVVMEPIRMRSRDLERAFDVSEDLPGRIRGKLTISSGSFSPGQIMLLARNLRSTQNYYYSGRPNLFGDFTFPDARGNFDLPLSEGQYQLVVVDLQTKLTLFESPRPIAVAATKTQEKNVTVEVARVTVNLAPETEGDKITINRIEIQATHPKIQTNRHIFGGNNNRDTGVGMPIAPGETSVTLLLPPVPCKLLARSDAHNLDPKVHQYNFPAQGEVELTPTAGKSEKIELSVSPPSIDLGEGEEKKAGAAKKGAVIELGGRR